MYITPTGCNNKCAVVLCGQLGSSAVVAGFLVSWFCGDMHDEPPETEKTAILFCDNLISHLEGIFKNCCTHTHTHTHKYCFWAPLAVLYFLSDSEKEWEYVKACTKLWASCKVWLLWQCPTSETFRNPMDMVWAIFLCQVLPIISYLYQVHVMSWDVAWRHRYLLALDFIYCPILQHEKVSDWGCACRFIGL